MPYHITALFAVAILCFLQATASLNPGNFIILKSGVIVESLFKQKLTSLYDTSHDLKFNLRKLNREILVTVKIERKTELVLKTVNRKRIQAGLNRLIS